MLHVVVVVVVVARLNRLPVILLQWRRLIRKLSSALTLLHLTLLLLFILRRWRADIV